MKPSAEISELLSSVFDTFGTNRMFETFSGMLPSDQGTLFVGTDDAEWWDNRESLMRALEAQAGELQGAQPKVTHVEGWEDGSVGWGAARIEVVFGDGPPARLRFTGTLVKEGDEWKMVQGHASVGVPNEEAVGKTLTI